MRHHASSGHLAWSGPLARKRAVDAVHLDRATPPPYPTAVSGRARALGAWIAAVTVSWSAPLGCGAPWRQVPASPPSGVILVVFDTLRADRLSAYGNPRETSPGFRRARPTKRALRARLQPCSLDPARPDRLAVGELSQPARVVGGSAPRLGRGGTGSSWSRDSRLHRRGLRLGALRSRSRLRSLSGAAGGRSVGA